MEGGDRACRGWRPWWGTPSRSWTETTWTSRS
jgi:hypothetical protein